MRERPPTSAPPERGVVRTLAWSTLGLWVMAALLVSWSQIQDRDLGFHLAWGRLLRADFEQVRGLTLGQSSGSVAFAYSYWIYQWIVAALWDVAGPTGVVALRASLVMAMLAVGGLFARKLGASLGAIALSLAIAVAVSFERFVDRPDLVSHLLWLAALWVLVFHRRTRGAWWLVAIEAVWANTHLYFSLLPPLILAFALGDAIERRLDVKRTALLLLAVIVASCVTPSGPAVWKPQLDLVRTVWGHALPFPVTELTSPFAKERPFLSLWIFRFALPASLLAIFLARRKLGWSVVLAVLFTAMLGGTARRTMSFYAIGVLPFLPVALDRVLRSDGPLRSALLGVTTACGVVGVIGLLNGHLYLAQDKGYTIGRLQEVQFPALGAARFLREAKVAGPLLHAPEAAGAILMENGARLDLFLDPRWLGKPEQFAAYTDLTHATDESVGEVWKRVDDRFHFGAVLLDAYAMPALLRHLDASADWKPVHSDDHSILFSRQSGANAGLTQDADGALRPSASANPEALHRLSAATLTSIERRRGSPLTPVTFPWPEFQRANLAMQRRDRARAVEAYAALLEKERGSLAWSAHRTEIWNNLLWCLTGTDQYGALAAVAKQVASEEPAPARRRGLAMVEAQARLMLQESDRALELASALAEDPNAAVNERWWARCAMAEAHRQQGRWSDAVAALRAAIQLVPADPSPLRSIGRILDDGVHDTAGALEAYRAFRAAGGQDSLINQRIAQLERTAP